MTDIVDTVPGKAPYIVRRLNTMARGMFLAVGFAVQFGLNGHVPFTTPSRTEAVVYGVLALVGLGNAVVLLLGGPRIDALACWVSVVVLLGCSVVMAGALPLDPAVRGHHWSFGVIGWYALMVLYDKAFGWLVAFFVVHLVVFAAPGVAAAEFSAMAVQLVSVFGAQLGVGLGSRVVRRIADAAEATARTEELLRLREQTAATAARDHERRYANLRETTIPLLAGLACGELDPAADDVRHRCAVDAARMRRLFSAREDAADRLVHELGAVIDVAERHGASVQLSVFGTATDLPERVRQDLLTPIADALVTARSPARVTVVHTPGEVRVSVRCARPAVPVARPGGGVVVTESDVDGQVWLETAWRSR